ncbi:phenylalanine--tRNA ligase subunit beta [Effusibacillus lacus]|uniref:Phenylalanine--tRNA ligase beta subunit n=1 Tax=Effusibacillus lacus TaxID=1348429 RepID=A0A292YQ93_9BACL|nr:phenylalanine--tRNA ligase subunit beta [Effusibacillus lacus]TCS70662.1 phenylalanyl-tRNA synthetase beta subunit [Effusibacillus lacus]GAX90660.1 phenylalanine--tRNA ligase subunit beta [Effusibacillus lacus]
MKISYNWLKEYIDLGPDMTPEQLGELLTNHGIPVEVIEPLNKGIKDVVVGHVLHTEPHPNADRLRVCTVDAGGPDKLQIVCGAPNVKPGQKVPCAVVGAELPGGVKIKRAKLRDVESQGMLCSASELGMDTRLLPKEQTEGLYILPEDAPVGESILNVLGLDDVVMELELTPNRADCLSYRGVAYEVAALLGKKPRFEEAVRTPNAGNGESPVKVRIESANCIQYSAQVVKGIQVKQSPLWMRMRLLAVGVRPINNIVDVTNYVMFEYGQPLHAFDLSEITESTIVVRQAEDNELLVTLDGQERKLDSSMLVIADPKRAVGLAGVMGGENSEVRDSTTDIVLESAYFDPGTIRQTGKKLGLRSEAQLRFEKGIDPAIMQDALLRAASLIAELGGGQIVGAPSAVVSHPVHEQTIGLRVSRTNQVIGSDLEIATIEDLLARLGFASSRKDEDNLEVVVPSRRPDITREIDLIEEVARLHGYDKIGTTMPQGVLSQGGLTDKQRLRRTVRELLTGMGLSEVMTYSFTNPTWLEPLGVDENSALRKQLPLALPMSDDRKVLRTTLLPSLVEVVQYNLNRKNMDLALFELGTVFFPKQLPAVEQPEEVLKVAGIVTGSFGPLAVGEKGRKVDFYTVKGIVETLLVCLGIPNPKYAPASETGMHPGRTALVESKGVAIGFLGALHPAVQEAWDLKETFYFELDFQALYETAQRKIEFRPLPKFPAIERDIAVVVPLDVPAGSLELTIRESAGDLLEEVRLFDVYQGEQVEAGKKSVAFSIVYRAEDRTLTDEEVQARHNRVVEALKQGFQAELRA